MKTMAFSVCVAFVIIGALVPHAPTFTSRSSSIVASAKSPCDYCDYCEFCPLCASDCPCDVKSNPNCKHCDKCTYCKFCGLCEYCAEGGVIDKATGAMTSWAHMMAEYAAKGFAKVGMTGVSDALDAWADIDHEQLDKDLKSVPKPKTTAKKKAAKTPKQEL